MTKIFNWITEFATLGIATVPIQYKTKIPLYWELYKTQLPTANELFKWFGSVNLINYAVVVGWQDLIVLDFDDMDKYNDWYLWALVQDDETDAYRVLQTAFKVRSARGVHVYVSIPEKMNNAHIAGLDIKAHGMVLGPGSTHPSGAIYTAQSPVINIPRVNSLSAILPLEWYEKLKENPDIESSGKFEISTGTINDPFVSAGLINTENAVAKILNGYKLETILSGVIKTGEHWYMALCPFHEDKNPSFWIDSKRQIGNCHKCNFKRPMDVINVYARMHQITEDEAIRILARTI